MSEREYKGWRIRYCEKQDKEGMWLDEVELSTQTGTPLVDLAAPYAKQQTIEKFRTREEALESGLSKAKTWIDRLADN